MFENDADDDNERNKAQTTLLKIVPLYSGDCQSTMVAGDIVDEVNDYTEQDLPKTLFADKMFGSYDTDECDSVLTEIFESNNIDSSENCDSMDEDDPEEPFKTSTVLMLEIEPHCSRVEPTGTTDFEENVNDSFVDDLYMSEGEITGRRIVDIGSLFTQIQMFSRHSETCHFEDIKLMHEIKRGLNSTFEFMCTSCGEYKRIASCPQNDTSLGVNEAAVVGIRSIGLGLSHIDEFFAHLNVPTMSNTLYDSICKTQQDEWWHLAKQSASDALEKEIELAKLNNEVDLAGNARLSVKVDGSWGKRSFGNNMNSLSGCAAIIGMRTRKIIYFGVRNKYCHSCKLAEVNKKEVKDHVCNKNYSGPSTGMETDIIIAGFQECDVRGARFDKYIADGDSNTYKVIRDIRIYKNPDMMVDKYDCVNHLDKNYRKKWRSLQKSTAYPVTYRKLMTNAKCNEIVKGVHMAAKHWRESDLDLTEKIRNLENDVMNAPDHYFGSHENCDIYFCEKQGDEQLTENIKMLKDSNLYDEILNASQHYYANNAKSLIANYSTNDNESFNNLVCKRLGGKRINNYLGGTYKASVAESVVHYNSGGQSGSDYHNFKLGESNIPRDIHKLELSRKRKCESNLLKKQLNPKVRRIVEPEELQTKGYYGINCQRPDIEVAAFDRAKQRFLRKLEGRQQQRVYIEEKTRGQRIIPLWFEVRQDLLPSSLFGRIVNTRNKSSFKNLLDDIMYKRTEFGNNADNKHQRIQELKALTVFKSIYTKNLKDCGIFIDDEICFLGASPFKLYGDNCLLSIKCPRKQFNKSEVEAMKKLQFWKNQSGKMTVNKESNWFIELQGQLHITKRSKAILMVWFGEEYKIEKIDRDDDFFDFEMREKLIYFFNEVMLKELVDSRKARCMEIREYNLEQNKFT